MSNKYKKRNQTPSTQEQQIMNDYNSDMKRNVIRKKYKITDGQIVAILRDAIKEKIAIAHPRHFKLND